MRGTLFIDELVRAILDDRKTVTRRRMRRQPEGIPMRSADGARWLDVTTLGALGAPVPPCAPLPGQPGKVGETQYVREVWAPADDGTTIYRATHPDPKSVRWRSSLLMPASRARAYIRIIDVRPWPLCGLDDAEARLEGIEDAAAFREGWDRLHAGHPDVLWERSPWVWRMEFVRCERPMEPT